METVVERDRVLWASTSARGGISAFVDAMADTPFWQKWQVEIIATHSDGNLLQKLHAFVRGLRLYLVQLILGHPALVHLHISQYGSFYRKCLLVQLARAFRVPVVLHIHGSQFDEFAASVNRSMRRLIRSTLENADAVFALGDSWADRLRTIAPNARITVLPNAVRPRLPVCHNVERPVRFAFLGKVGERKGTFVLLDAWSKMPADVRNGSRAHLTIAGDGNVNRARRLVAEYGLGASVDVLGWLERDEARALVASSNVLVLPSQNEGQPMAILEAMAHGLCVIASRVGGIPEMLRDDAGILISPDSVSDLVSAMDVACDPGIRTRFGRNALQRIRTHYDLALLSDRIDKEYTRILTEQAI